MDAVSNHAVKVDDLDALFHDIGLLTDPVTADGDVVREESLVLHRALKLLLVSGKLDKNALILAVELAEAM